MTPTATTVTLTNHAIDRFRTRCRPGLDGESAAAELARLVGEIGEIAVDPPPWATLDPAPDGVVMLGSDVCLVLRQGREGCVATTLLARTPRGRRRHRHRRHTLRKNPVVRTPIRP